MWRPFAEGVMRPLLSFCQQCRGPPRQWMLVCPPVVAVVCRLVDLRLLLNGGVLAALSSAALSREEKVISHLYANTYTHTHYMKP